MKGDKEEHHDLSFLPNNMKPKRMRWIRHRVKKNTYRASLENLKK